MKARIEEFNALAGHEHVHKGMTSRDLTENVEQLQVRRSLEHVRDRTVAVLVRLAALAVEHGETVMAGRSHNVAAQATTLGKRFATAADELLVAYARLDNLIERYPCAASRARSARRRTCSTCWAATSPLWTAGAPRGRPPRVLPGVRQRWPGLPAVARLRRGDHARPGGGRPVEPGEDHPADGRPRTGHGGLPTRPGRLVGHAAQDEHPIERTRERLRRDPARLRLDGRRTGRRPVERGRRVVLGRAHGWRCRTRSSLWTA